MNEVIANHVIFVELYSLSEVRGYMGIIQHHLLIDTSKDCDFNPESVVTEINMEVSISCPYVDTSKTMCPISLLPARYNLM